jgi:hypothetical protein
MGRGGRAAVRGESGVVAMGVPIRRVLRRVQTDAYPLDVLVNPAVLYWAWPLISLVSCVLFFLLVHLPHFCFLRFLSNYCSFFCLYRSSKEIAWLKYKFFWFYTDTHEKSFSSNKLQKLCSDIGTTGLFSPSIV